MSEKKPDTAALAKTLRRIIGDGSMGWVTDPIQAGFLRDVADALDENDKLRELCWKFAEYTDQDRCLGCVVKRACRNGDVEECPLFTKIRELAHELGIRVIE